MLFCKIKVLEILTLSYLSNGQRLKWLEQSLEQKNKAFALLLAQTDVCWKYEILATFIEKTSYVPPHFGTDKQVVQSAFLHYCLHTQKIDKNKLLMFASFIPEPFFWDVLRTCSLHPTSKTTATKLWKYRLFFHATSSYHLAKILHCEMDISLLTAMFKSPMLRDFTIDIIHHFALNDHALELCYVTNTKRLKFLKKYLYPFRHVYFRNAMLHKNVIQMRFFYEPSLQNAVHEYSQRMITSGDFDANVLDFLLTNIKYTHRELVILFVNLPPCCFPLTKRIIQKILQLEALFPRTEEFLSTYLPRAIEFANPVFIKDAFEANLHNIVYPPLERIFVEKITVSFIRCMFQYARYYLLYNRKYLFQLAIQNDALFECLCALGFLQHLSLDTDFGLLCECIRYDNLTMCCALLNSWQMDAHAIEKAFEQALDNRSQRVTCFLVSRVQRVIPKIQSQHIPFLCQCGLQSLVQGVLAQQVLSRDLVCDCYRYASPNLDFNVLWNYIPLTNDELKYSCSDLFWIIADKKSAFAFFLMQSNVVSADDIVPIRSDHIVTAKRFFEMYHFDFDFQEQNKVLFL